MEKCNICRSYSRQIVNEKAGNKHGHAVPGAAPSPLTSRPQVDVWALGCMAYLLAFNRHAFPDGSALATLTGKYTIPPAHGRSQQVQTSSSASRRSPLFFVFCSSVFVAAFVLMREREFLFQCGLRAPYLNPSLHIARSAHRRHYRLPCPEAQRPSFKRRRVAVRGGCQCRRALIY